MNMNTINCCFAVEPWNYYVEKSLISHNLKEFVAILANYENQVVQVNKCSNFYLFLLGFLIRVSHTPRNEKNMTGCNFWNFDY